MHVIDVRNVHAALPEALYRLRAEGVERGSRNGPVRVMMGPVTTVYRRPAERVIFWPDRDANPFFHLFESLWMLAGRRDVAYPSGFAKQIAAYSDDGKTLHGAYGHRWIHHFGFNQLDLIIETLRANPDDRRCVLQMWDPRTDLGKQGKDFPCNTAAFFSVNVAGQVDMTVLNRSNDVIWGAYGANAVHFSMLQEYVASAIGRPLGTYWQVSNNFHVYQDWWEKLQHIADRADDPMFSGSHNPYETTEGCEPYPIMTIDKKTWDQDLLVFLEDGPIIGFRDPFFRRVATPMFMAYQAFKQKNDPRRFDAALEIVSQCRAYDWRLAAEQWLRRRQEAAERKGGA